VRVYELGIGDEDESVRVRASFLDAQLVFHASDDCGQVCIYPVLPPVPIATPHSAIEHAPFTPVQHPPPKHHQRIYECTQALETPLSTHQRIVSPLHTGSYPVQEEGSRNSPRLVSQTLRFRVCADGNAIFVVRLHDLVKEWGKYRRSIFCVG
jgi:hypothetical protein